MRDEPFDVTEVLDQEVKISRNYILCTNIKFI